MPEQQTDDPILSRSFSFAILVSAFLLVLTLAWSLYDEIYGLRPWREYQRRFAATYEKFLRGQMREQAKQEKEIEESADYRRLEGEY